MNLKKSFLYVFIASVAASALIGIGVLLLGSFGEIESRVLMTTFTVTLTSILGLACGAYYESGKGKTLPATGIALSVIAALICIYLIWIGDGGEDLIWKSGATAGMLATAIAHLSLISLASLDSRFMWSRFTLYGCVSAMIAILLYILWFEPDSSGDFVARLLGVLGIVIAALTLLTPVLHKLSRKDVANEIDAEIAILRGRIEELEQRKRDLVRV